MVTNCDMKSFGLRRKNPNIAQTLAPLTVLIRIQAFRNPLSGDFPHVQIFINNGPNPVTGDAQLLSYWFSGDLEFIQEYLVNLINNHLGGHCFPRPGRSAIQVEISPRLNWATQYLTVAYDGACSPNIHVRMAWISFGALPCRKKELMMTTRVLKFL